MDQIYLQTMPQIGESDPSSGLTWFDMAKFILAYAPRGIHHMRARVVRRLGWLVIAVFLCVSGYYMVVQISALYRSYSARKALEMDISNILDEAKSVEFPLKVKNTDTDGNGIVRSQFVQLRCGIAKTAELFQPKALETIGFLPSAWDSRSALIYSGWRTTRDGHRCAVLFVVYVSTVYPYELSYWIALISPSADQAPKCRLMPRTRPEDPDTGAHELSQLLNSGSLALAWGREDSDQSVFIVDVAQSILANSAIRVELIDCDHARLRLITEADKRSGVNK